MNMDELGCMAGSGPDVGLVLYLGDGDAGGEDGYLLVLEPLVRAAADQPCLVAVKPDVEDLGGLLE
jgi:hypothetical protein